MREPRFHEGASGPIQGLTGRAQDVVNDLRYRGRGRGRDRRTLEHAFAILSAVGTLAGAVLPARTLPLQHSATAQ
jgi:hypothetical protein